MSVAQRLSALRNWTLFLALHLVSMAPIPIKTWPVSTAVLERNPSSPGGKVQERFGVSTRIHRNLHSVLEDSTPNATHYEFAKLAS
jgi:hypothetical protein